MKAPGSVVSSEFPQVVTRSRVRRDGPVQGLPVVGLDCGSVSEAEVIEEIEAEEVPLEEGDLVSTEPVRPLPARNGRRQVEQWRGEMRTAALAAAGGLVAGAATVAMVRAARGGGRASKPAKRSRRAEALNIVASRSFVIDVHMLGNGR
jgi:hypothetical protein